jgi:predicted RNA binding protein YcfA (HicA-like mRNA interferase family)
MPSKVPRITGQDAINAFGKCGYALDRIKGSHHILRHPSKPERLSIPVHGNETVGIGLLGKQIKLAGLSNEEFVNLL